VRGAFVTLLCCGLAWNSAAAMPGPPAGLQGLLTPAQEADGPPGCVRASTRLRLPVFAQATLHASPLGWLVFQPWAADSADCLAVAPVLETAGSDEPAPVPTLESGYETPALLVLERRGDWHRIQLPHGSGWLQAPAGHRFESYPALLAEKLAYATPAWAGELCRAPGENCSSDAPPPGQPLKVLGSKDHAGETWLEVELTTDGCRDGEARTQDRGWLRARAGDGRPVAWFHSRGC
jgi:hypothetical protein